MKKITSKIICALLSLALIAAALPLGAFTVVADGKTTVNSAGATFNKEYLPRAGEDVIPYDDFVSVSKGDVYEKTGRGVWYSDEVDPGSNNSEMNYLLTINYSEAANGYKFEAGRTYYYSFTLSIKSGFKNTHAFPSKGKDVVNFTARNLENNRYTVEKTVAHGSNVSILLKFTVSGERTYDDIENVYCYKYYSTYANGDVLPPVQGKTYPRMFSNYNNYTMDYSWEGDFTDLSSQGISGAAKVYFEAGNEYKMILTYTAKPGYKFAEDCEFTVVKQFELTADPYIKITPDKKTLSEDRTKLTLEFNYLVEDYKDIDVITLSNKCSPKDGFYPKSSTSLTDAMCVGYYLDDDLPYERRYTTAGFSTFSWENDKGDSIESAPLRGLVKYGIHLEMKEAYKDIYRFSDNPTVLIDGLDTNNYWAKCEFLTNGSYKKGEIFITLYFIADYHNESSKTGSTYERRMQVHSFEGLKFAMEQPGIQYIELENCYDTLPIRKYETAYQVEHQLRDSGIKVTGKKTLVITGENILNIEQADPTAFLTYDNLFRIDKGGDLTVTGTGSLNVNFGQPNYPAAMFFNKGTLSVEDGVTLYADATYSDVYPQVINNAGGKLTITGGCFTCKNTMAVEDAAVVLGYNSEAYIDGGTFNATYGSGGTGTNYGLMLLTDQLSLEINRGTFKTNGGILLPNDETSLSEYCSGLNHICTSGGYVREPYQITKSFLSNNGGTTQIFEMVMDFYANADIPVAGKTPRAGVSVAGKEYKLRADPTWYCNGQKMSQDTEFAIGNQYSVQFDLQTKSTEGYRLHGNLDYVSAYVNGKSATVSKSNYANTVTVEYTFGECKDCVFSVSGLVDEPRENDTPGYATCTDEYGKVVTNGVKWYKRDIVNPDTEWEDMDKYEKFISSDYAYEVKILIQINSKYVLNANSVGEPLIDAYLNGSRCNYEPYYDNTGTINNKYVYLSYVWPQLVDSEIETIDINITAPAPGAYPTYLADIASGQFTQLDKYNWGYTTGIYDGQTVYYYYGHYGVQWYDLTNNGKEVYDTDTFIEGHEYRMLIRLEAYPEYEFYVDRHDGSLVTATVNGEEAELYGTCNQWEHGVAKTFVCTGESPKYNLFGVVSSVGSESDAITLTLTLSGESEPAYEAVVTGTKADYLFSDVPVGEYTLKATKYGHAPFVCPIVITKTSVVKDITLLAAGLYLPGDLNLDGEVTDQDAVYLLFYTFFPDAYPVDQPVDFDGSGAVDDQDAVYLLFYTFFPDAYPI